MTQELKNCPFCSGEARLFSVTLPMVADCSDIYVQCGECDVIGPTILFDQDSHDAADISGLEAGAIAAWNTRTIPDPQAFMEAARGVREALERLIAACDRGRQVPKPGAGVCGMTIEAQMRATCINGVDAWPVEEAREAFYAFDATLGEQ